MTNNDFSFPSFEEHEEEQIIFTAKNTTAAQRFKWLEDMFETLKDYLPDRSKVDG